MLILGVALLVAVDLTILIIYIVVEEVRGNLVAMQVSNREMSSTTEGVRVRMLRLIMSEAES